MNSCTTQLIYHTPRQIVLSRHLLAVGESKRSGLILCKQHYAEFAGPGAAICDSHEMNYVKVVAIGSPEITPVTSYEERQQAYSRRIQWVRWLHRIVSESDAFQRAEKLFAGFEEFFGSEVLSCISDEVLALLAGVLPHTIANLRSEQLTVERKELQNYPFSDCLDVQEITLNGKYERRELQATSTRLPSNPLLFETVSPLLCSA